MLQNGWISRYRLNVGMNHRGLWYRNFHHPWLKSRGVVTVLEDEFQSPPSPTIHYTHNDILEGLGCCELPESVSTHTIWVRKVSTAPSQICTLSELENRLWWPFLCPYTNLNHVKPFIILVKRDWKGWDAVKWLNKSLQALYLGMNNVGAMHQINFMVWRRSKGVN